MSQKAKELLYPLPQSFKACKFEELLVCFVNVLYPKVTTKLLLVDILSRIPLKGMENFPWTVARVENIFQSLKSKNLINAQAKPSLKEGHGLLCYLLQFEEGRMLAELLPSRLRTCKQNISSYDIDCTQANVAFYLNAENAEAHMRKVAFKYDVAPFYKSNPPDNFFRKLRTKLQILIIESAINSYLTDGIANANYQYISNYIDVALDKEIYTTTILSYFAFASFDLKKFDEIKKIIEKAHKQKFEDELDLKYFSLFKEFCNVHSSEQAVELAKKFKDAYKFLKKYWNDPHYSFPFPFDILYLFTLLKAYNNLSEKDAVKKDYFAYLKHSGLTPAELQLFEHLIHANLSERMLVYLLQKDLEEQKLSPLCAIIYFVNLYKLPRDKERDVWFVQALKNYFSKTKEYAPFSAAIFAQFLVKLVPLPEQKEYADYKEKYSIFDFTTLFSDELSWEKRMQAIYAFMQNKESEPKKKISKNPKRLAWLVSMNFREIYPYEQSFSKEAWTKGRKVSALKLRDETDSYEYLTDQDKLVIKKSVKKDYWADTYTIDFESAMPLLAEHPLVFDEQSGENIVLELKEPILEVENIKKEKSEEFRLTFEIPSVQTGVFLQKESRENTFTVIPVTPAHVKLKELMGAENLVLPQKAHEMLFDILSQEKSPIKVRTKIEFNELPSEQVNAKPTLRLKRLHLKDELGLEAQAIVYPLYGHTTNFVPTKGSDSFVAKVQNNPVKIKRLFADEEIEMQKLFAQSNMLKENLLNENYNWQFNTAEEAYSLLAELQHIDVTIEWYDSEPIKISKTFQKDDLKLKVRSKNNWFSLDANLSVDEDLVINMRSLLKNVSKHKGRFIPLASGQVLALTEDFRKALDKVSAITQEDKDELILHSLAVPALESIFDEEEIETDVKYSEWKDKLSLLDENIMLPKGLQAELRPYQVEGFSWMASLLKIEAGACLADDMGLGKTLQTITLLLSLMQESNALEDDALFESRAPFLIVAPTSVCHNWEVEIMRFAPQLKVKRLTASYSKKERKNILENLETNEVLIVGYALLNTELETLLTYDFKLVVFDEAQALKNPQAMRSKASYKLKAKSKLALTGTPVENSLDDLWSIFNIINPGLLGSMENFIKRFNPSSLAPESVKNNARNNLKSLVKPFILRRTKTAVLDELPPRTEQTLLIEPSKEERALYEALRRHAVENIEKAKKEGEKNLQFHMLAELTKMRRACCNPVLIDPLSDIQSSKLDTLLKLVQDLQANNHQALIFSQFTSHLSIVHDEIEKLGIRILYLDGSTPEKKRAERVAAFQNGQADIFCISLKAGGQGLNLTAADYVIHLDPWWNPAVEDQASDRAHRMGQQRPVTIYRLIMQGSIEEKILKLHATKRELADDILLNTDTAHKLSIDDLLQLLQ